MRVLEIERGGERMRVATYLTDAEIADLRGLPARGVVGVVGEDGVLRVNGVFREFLHETIAREAPRDPDMQKAAEARGEGRLVFVDSRVPEEVQPVPEEDVLGWFAVREGRIVPGSYVANPEHRVEGRYGWSAAIGGMRVPMVRALRAGEGKSEEPGS